MWIQLGGGMVAVLLASLLIGWRRRSRHWLAAFLEQGRVEAAHHTGFRDDQRLNAIQQRLARTLGKRHAFGLRTRRRLERELARMKSEKR